MSTRPLAFAALLESGYQTASRFSKAHRSRVTQINLRSKPLRLRLLTRLATPAIPAYGDGRLSSKLNRDWNIPHHECCTD
jgi:hypothetical protein